MTLHDDTETQAVADLAMAAAGSEELDQASVNRHAFIVPADADLRIVEPVPDRDLPAPRRVAGDTVVLDVDSYAHLFEKYAQANSETYADLDRKTITTVINADADHATAGHRDHRLVLQCKLTTAWKAWTGIDGMMLGQVEFAEFIEDRLVDIAEPTGAEMLELAQTFQATTGVDFKAAAILSSSARSLSYEETVQARAGHTGSIEIPAAIYLGVAPFEGGDGYRVKARFRYRIERGGLKLGIKLERPEDVVSNAFDDVRSKVAEQTTATVLLGTTPSAR